MTDASSSLAPWVWPVKPDDYDRTAQLEPGEVETLRAAMSCLLRGASPSQAMGKCHLPRLLTPLEDVCSHTGLSERYRSNLKIAILRDMAARGRCFLGLDRGRVDRKHQERWARKAYSCVRSLSSLRF